MFDPKKPYNDLPELPPNNNFDDIEILKKVNKANIQLASLNNSSIAIPNSALLIEPLSVREAVASSGIEDINTTVSEVFRAELFPEKEMSKAQKETLHYTDALRAGYDLIMKDDYLHTNSYIDIQKILEPNKRGIRKLPGTSIKNATTGEILYTPPEGEKIILDLLSNYEKFYNDISDEIDPLIRMAILHYQFECIHPFYDGNGRTGRILMVLYLVLMKRLNLPILFISGYIQKHRSDYYRLLREVTKENNWKDWVMYILTAVETQAHETAETVLKIKDLQDKTADDIRTNLSKIYSMDLVNYLFANPFYNQTQLAKALRIHHNTSMKYMNLLLEKNILHAFKHKKEKIYYNKKFLDLLDY